MSRKADRFLLVVLGHQNTSNGELSPTARLRCSSAIDIIYSKSVQDVLVTGAFGENFNTSDVPHGVHMIRYVAQCLGKNHSKIRFYQSATAFTEEDIFAARRISVDLGINKVIFLTSTFHMSRVKIMAKYIFRDRFCAFEEAPDGSDIVQKRVQKKEARDILNFEKRWVDCPLYSRKSEPFPSVLYDDARKEHKHDDTVSLSILSAAFLIAAYPCSKLIDDSPDLNSIRTALFCSGASILLFVLYGRFAVFAYFGRALMRSIELSWGTPGVSYNQERFVYSKWKLSKFFGTVIIVGIILFSVIAFDLAKAIWFFYGSYISNSWIVNGVLQVWNYLF